MGEGTAPGVADLVAPGPGEGASVVVLLFAAAREAAGTGRMQLHARTVAEVHETARRRFGEQFSLVLERCRTWVNGEPADGERRLIDRDEIAILPPVSGGSGGCSTGWT